MDIPHWLDHEAWEGWCESRRAMKRVPFTERARKIALRQLEVWHFLGFDTTYILDESTLKGWRGLFISERTPRKMQATTSNEAQMSLVNQAIEESQRTGRPADAILAELRARA